MVVVLKTESATQILSADLLKTIYSIREIVGNHSDSEIYNALKECNMDPNETAQKLLNQDPFHEVRRRRDKKKENAVHNGNFEPRKHSDSIAEGGKIFNSDRHGRRGGYSRSAVYDAGVSREFRVVRDNRVNQNSERDTKALPQAPSSMTVGQSTVSYGSVSVSSHHQRHPSGRYVQSLNGITDFQPKVARDFNSNTRKEHLDDRRSGVISSRTQVSTTKSSDPRNPASSNAVGVYASTSDPVHVPSPEVRSSSAIGAIRCEVGVVGSYRQSSETASKLPSQQSSSDANSTGRNSSSKDSSRLTDTFSHIDQPHTSVAESTMISSAGSRLGNHLSNRIHQQTVGHQKGFLPSKEWKPKTSQKIVPSPGMIGSPVKSASKTADDSKNVDKEADVLENKLSQVNIHQNQNVIIAQHIRILENDRWRLTFGSFEIETDGTEKGSEFQATDSAEEAVPDPSLSNKQINSIDDQVPTSGFSNAPLTEAAKDQLPENRDSAGVPTAEDYADNMALVPKSQSFAASELQKAQDHTDLPNLSAYDHQCVYDIPYFRPSVDDTVGGPGLPSAQEALSSHTTNSISESSVMQQQAPMAQMYPQLHVSHFTNVMPYRQFLSPVYVPPVVPGYSGNPGYPPLPNGGNYVLMPGGGSHVSASNIKYGVQQFKPLPAGSPAGFCNFVNPSAYAIGAPGVVGGPVGLDDSSRLKYKDNSLYAPNPPAETSEVWIQNLREIGGIQTTPYYNLQGQTAGHLACLQSHPGHTSFNAAGGLVQQSSHVQFPGMYQQQQNVMPNAHHSIGVGVGPAPPGAQIGGAFQQPQIGHLNWTANY